MRKIFLENEEEKKVGGVMPMNLQFFAESNDDDDVDDNDDDDDVDDNDNDDDNDDDSSDDSKSKSSKGTKGGKGGKTFTQKQVTAMMSKEKKQGKSSVYKELGIDPKDSKMVQAVKDYISSQKTDEQKAAEEKEKMSEAEKRAQIAEAKAEAMMLGVKPEYVEDVVTLALSKMDDESDLKTIIGEFKTKYSVWFGESSDDDDDNDGSKKTGKKGTGSSVKSKKDKKGDEDSKGLGARLAAQRKSSTKKSSYWGKN